MSTLFNAFEIPEQTIQSDTGAAYTIPENYYAIAHVQTTPASPTILVNGKSVISGMAPIKAAFATPSTTTAGRWTVYTATDNVSVTIALERTTSSGTNPGTASASSEISFNGSIVNLNSITGQTGGIRYDTVNLGAGDSVYISRNGSSFYPFSASIYVSGSAGSNQENATIKLKSGDVISGGRYHLELYRIPGTA